MIYYPIPMHMSTAYCDSQNNNFALPNCEKLSKIVLSLPMHPYLSPEEISYISNSIRQSL